MRSSPLLPGVCSIATPTVEGVTAVRLYSKLAWSRRAAPLEACKPPCKVGGGGEGVEYGVRTRPRDRAWCGSGA